jgi:hypothetical protein
VANAGFMQKKIGACHKRLYKMPNPPCLIDPPIPALLSERLIKILDQIVRILEADRQSQETFR